MLPFGWQPDSQAHPWAEKLFSRHFADLPHLLFGGSFTRDNRRAFLIRAHGLDREDLNRVMQCAMQNALQVKVDWAGCIHVLLFRP